MQFERFGPSRGLEDFTAGIKDVDERREEYTLEKESIDVLKALNSCDMGPEFIVKDSKADISVTTLIEKIELDGIRLKVIAWEKPGKCAGIRTLTIRYDEESDQYKTNGHIVTFSRGQGFASKIEMVSVSLLKDFATKQGKQVLWELSNDPNAKKTPEEEMAWENLYAGGGKLGTKFVGASKTGKFRWFEREFLPGDEPQFGENDRIIIERASENLVDPLILEEQSEYYKDEDIIERKRKIANAFRNNLDLETIS